MTLEQALAFSAAAAVLTILPGPDTFLVLRNTVRHGRQAGLLTTLGICPGVFVHATVSAVGMAAVLRHAPWAWGLLQALGAAYLTILGARSLRDAYRLYHHPQGVDLSQAVAMPVARRLLEGFLSNILNPKTMVFYMAFLPQFLRPGDAVWSTSLLLTSLHWAEGMLWLGFLVLAIGHVRSWLLRPSTLVALEVLSGLLLVGFGVRLALERM